MENPILKYIGLPQHATRWSGQEVLCFKDMVTAARVRELGFYICLLKNLIKSVIVAYISGQLEWLKLVTPHLSSVELLFHQMPQDHRAMAPSHGL